MASRDTPRRRLRNALKNGNSALLVGNGINYGTQTSTIDVSWKNLLISVYEQVFNSSLPDVPDGVAYTELYDLIELKCRNEQHRKEVRKGISDGLATWKSADRHEALTRYAQSAELPILTTNYDSLLSDSMNLKAFRMIDERKGMGFSRYYPWTNYFSDRTLSDPLDGFSIWHIHGQKKYADSLRLSLTDYMGAVVRARRMLRSKDASLYDRKKRHQWAGCKTWMHIFFNKPIVVMGLGMRPTEVFLRWLLIQKSKYHQHIGSDEAKGYFLDIHSSKEDKGHELFIKAVGLEPVYFDSYEEIYDGLWE